MIAETSASHRAQDQEVTEYHRHLRALETLATQLERQDLDPQEALGVYRKAAEHYHALDAILRQVEKEVEKLESPGGAPAEPAAQEERGG